MTTFTKARYRIFLNGQPKTPFLNIHFDTNDSDFYKQSRAILSSNILYAFLTQPMRATHPTYSPFGNRGVVLVDSDVRTVISFNLASLSASRMRKLINT